MTFEQKIQATAAIGLSFSPGTPIDTKDLFAGRAGQISEIVSLIYQKGQHGAIYGERGVGKTSLVSVLVDFLAPVGAVTPSQPDFVRVNCDVGVGFEQLWRSVFRRLWEVQSKPAPGFAEGARSHEITNMADMLVNNPSPEDVRLLLERLDNPAVVIIDEVDRISDQKTTTQLADTIKSLSDHAVRSKVIFVGVADSVSQLIAEHKSIERSLVQIKMPRMSISELLEILDKCFQKAGMKIADGAKERIARLSEGLPHYTHLLGQQSAYAALDENQMSVSEANVTGAIARAVANAQHSILDAYHSAVSSPRETLYPQVLLACAMAPTDDLGYFAARDVREPMTKIMGAPYDVPAFSRHLNDFCERKRGPILQKQGEARRFRFRFINPLMEPFVIMNGISKGLVKEEVFGGTSG